MEKTLSKPEIETVTLQLIMAGPYKECGSCRIYTITKTGEEMVIRRLAGTKEVETLTELEDAVNSPKVEQIYIGKYASVTSKGLKSVLSRTSLTKNIFCAFDFKE